jgi:hypothetical protein
VTASTLVRRAKDICESNNLTQDKSSFITPSETRVTKNEILQALSAPKRALPPLYIPAGYYPNKLQQWAYCRESCPRTCFPPVDFNMDESLSLYLAYTLHLSSEIGLVHFPSFFI